MTWPRVEPSIAYLGWPKPVQHVDDTAGDAWRRGRGPVLDGDGLGPVTGFARASRVRSRTAHPRCALDSSRGPRSSRRGKPWCRRAGIPKRHVGSTPKRSTCSAIFRPSSSASGEASAATRALSASHSRRRSYMIQPPELGDIRRKTGANAWRKADERSRLGAAEKAGKTRQKRRLFPAFSNGDDWTRTSDPGLMNPLLYRLSYVASKPCILVVGVGGSTRLEV